MRIILLILLFSSSTLSAQYLLVSQTSYTELIDVNDIENLSEAGEDLEDTHSSTTMNFDISNLRPGQTWEIVVRREDMSMWPGALELFIVETANTANAVRLTSSDQIFLTGVGSQSNVQFYLELRSLSLTVDASNYASDIVYTLRGN